MAQVGGCDRSAKTRHPRTDVGNLFAARLPVVDWAAAPRNAARQRPFVAPIARPLSLLRSPRPRPRSLFFPSSRPLPARPAGVLLSGGRTDSQDRMDRIHHAACMVNEALRAGLAVDRNVLTNWARRDVLSRGGPIPCPPCGRARSGGRTDSQDRMDRIHHAACMVNVPLRGLVLDPKCLRSSFPRPPHLSADMPPARAPCGRASFRRAHGFPPWHIAL
jgi:hypothetical protein